MIVESIHDFRIKKVLFIDEDTVLEFLGENSEKAEIRLKKFSFININSDYFENIVSEAYIFKSEELSNIKDPYINDRYSSFYRFAGIGKHVFLIVPVVGLELFCVCESIDIFVNDDEFVFK